MAKLFSEIHPDESESKKQKAIDYYLKMGQFEDSDGGSCLKKETVVSYLKERFLYCKGVLFGSGEQWDDRVKRWEDPRAYLSNMFSVRQFLLYCICVVCYVSYRLQCYLRSSQKLQTLSVSSKILNKFGYKASVSGHNS